MGFRAQTEKTQVAALPYQAQPDGAVRVLLITSRETGRWVIPKGWPMKGRTPADAAAREAFEEAGVRGTIGAASIGRYSYPKRLKNGSWTPCVVDVFPLHVERQDDQWPEMGQRRSCWVPPGQAAALVQEEGLRAILLRVQEAFAPR